MAVNFQSGLAGFRFFVVLTMGKYFFEMYCFFPNVEVILLIRQTHLIHRLKGKLINLSHQTEFLLNNLFPDVRCSPFSGINFQVYDVLI
jgi:hypothetical protein